MRKTLGALALTALTALAISLSFPASADAQHVYGGGYYGHQYGYGFYGHGFYGHPFYGPGYGFGGYGGYGYRTERSNVGEVRIEVNPKNSREDIQVFVNGAYAGVVDNFDGYAQRLYLAPGEYVLELRLDGYESVHTTLYVSVGTTHKIRGEMERLVGDGGNEADDVPSSRRSTS